MQLAELMTQLGYPTSAEEMAGRMHTISRDETFATFVAAEGNDVLGMIGVSDCPSYEHNDRNGRIIALVVHAGMCAGADSDAGSFVSPKIISRRRRSVELFSPAVSRARTRTNSTNRLVTPEPGCAL